MRHPVILLVLLVLLAVNFKLAWSQTCAGATAENPIKYLIVLMMENRSFDHMLGFLKRENPEIDGLKGDESNYFDPDNPSPETKVVVNSLASYVDPDLDHSVDGTSQEISWGSSENIVSKALMDGFVARAHQKNSNWGPQALSMFNQTSVPVISTLALDFALIDQYHASIPGPTMVNRAYAFSATSHGYAYNSLEEIAIGFPQETIFDQLDNADVSWGVFFQDAPSAISMRHTRRHPKRFHLMESFAKHLEENTLPQFSFLEPAYFGSKELGIKPRDQHPSHNVQYGEELMKWVYDNLRQSEYWNCSALVINYDEHGGFYDHKPTLLTGVPNPDGLVSKDPPFNFTRIGIRVPMVVISPWVEKGAVFHDPDPSNGAMYEHSSIPRTVRDTFNIDSPPLTKRDEWAASFEHVWKQRTTPRTDCPESMPTPPSAEFFKSKDEWYSTQLPLTGFQKNLVGAAAGFAGVPIPENIHEMVEEEASLWLYTALSSLRQQHE